MFVHLRINKFVIREIPSEVSKRCRAVLGLQSVLGLQCRPWNLAETMLGLEALDSPKTPRLGAQLRLRRSSGSASDDSFTSSSPSPARDVEQLGSPSHAAAPAASSRPLHRQPSLDLDQYAAVLSRAALSRQSTTGNLEIEQLTSLGDDEGAAAGQQQEGRGSLDGIVQFSAEPEGPPSPILATPTLLSRQQAADSSTGLYQTSCGTSAETPEHEDALAAAAPAPAAARAFFNSPNVGRRPGSLSPAAATAATAQATSTATSTPTSTATSTATSSATSAATSSAAAARDESAAARDEAAALAEELAALEEEEKTFEAWVQAEEAAIAAEEARLAAIEAEEARAMAEAAAAAAAAAYSAATKKSGALFMDQKPGCQRRDSCQIRDSPGCSSWCSPIAVPASVMASEWL